jgi:hypothetical protein
MMNMGIFIIIFFLVFATFFIPKNIIHFQFMEKNQYFELFFASLLIIFFFGYFHMLITNNSNYLNTSFKFASFFLIWYFLTKTIVNLIHTNNNIIYY